MSENKSDKIQPECNCASVGFCTRGTSGIGGRCYGQRIFRIIIIIAAIVLMSVHITGDLYGDEGHSFRTISQGKLLENLNQANSCHPPLFFALAKLFWLITGKMWAIRIPSLLGGIGTLLVTWPLSKRLLGDRLVTPSLLLVGFSPLLIEFATEARPYAMLAFFSTLLIWLMARFLERETAAGAVLLALTAAAGLATHFIFAAQLVFVAIWYLCVRRKLTKFSIAALVLFMPVGAYLVLGATDDAGFSKDFTAAWRSAFSWKNYIAKLPFALTFGYSTFDLGQLGSTRQVGGAMVRQNLHTVIPCLVFFVSLAGAIVYAVAKRVKNAGLLIAIIAVPVLVGLLGGKAGFYLLREKYFIGSVVPLMLLIVLSMDKLISLKRIGIFPAACFGFVVIISLWHYAAMPEKYSRRTFRGQMNARISSEISDGDMIASYNINRVEPWYFTVLDNFENIDDLRQSLGKKVPAETAIEHAVELDSNVSGKIYLIDREMDRNATDGKNAFFEKLSQLRKRTTDDYGRNLKLHIFEKTAVEDK